MLKELNEKNLSPPEWLKRQPEPGSSGPPMILHNRYDEYTSSIHPDHQPTSQEALRGLLFTMGATEETLPQYLEKYNKQFDEMLQSLPGGKIPTLGVCGNKFIIS